MTNSKIENWPEIEKLKFKTNYRLKAFICFNFFFSFLLFVVFCPQELKSISEKGIRIVTGVDQGTVMRDPYSDKFWVTYGYNNVDEVVEYNSIRGEKLWKLSTFLSL